MKLVVAAATFLTALLGIALGYRTAGVGGAILYGGLIALGGALLATLLVRTVLLLRHSWKVVAATVVLLVLTILTWGVYL